MTNIPSTTRLTRRKFLLLTAAGVTAVGGYALAEYAPWLDYAGQAAQTWRPGEGQSTTPAGLRELVRHATLAANGHNTQPWRFALGGDTIEIRPDFARRLPVVDPQDRELWISLGCALENLLVAARASGYAAEVSYPDAADVIRVRLTDGEQQREPQRALQREPLFDAIPRRQNTRSAYDGRPVVAADLDQVLAIPLEPGVTLRLVSEAADMAQVQEAVREGNLSQYGERAFVDELIHWLRFNQRAALAGRDGLYSRCSGNPEVPGWLGRMFVASGKPEQQADADAAKLASSAGALVIASAADDKSTWVRTGQVYERLALQMTSLSIKSAFLNQPIEVDALRGQFGSALGLSAALPQLLVRFGYAADLARSLRRPVEQVLI